MRIKWLREVGGIAMTNQGGKFHTVRGYELLNQGSNVLTPSMEDYLEMSYRLGKDKGYARISDLAQALNVQPPSASKMVQKLAEMGYLNYERYGVIEFTELGREIGEYLLKRHETIQSFLIMIGVVHNTLEDTEKIEHSISEETYKYITLFSQFIQQNQQLLEAYRLFLEQNSE
jgi:DtxR family Mn-dependent transcriptional regulator